MKFPVTSPAHGALANASVVIWTTTPWTLPTNMALAVGPEIEYAIVPSGPLVEPVEAREYLLAADTIGSYFKEFGYASALGNAMVIVIMLIMGLYLRRQLREAI